MTLSGTSNAQSEVDKETLSASSVAGNEIVTHQIELFRRKDILRFVGVTFFWLALLGSSAELVCRFVVFLGKPALSANPQYDVKYLVAKTVTPWTDNIVLCGDSLVKQGFYPELIASKLQKINDNIRVVNLAVNGGSQNDAIAYLDFLLKMRCTKPRLVVYDFEVSATSGREGPTVEEWGRPTGYLFAAKLRRPKDVWKTLELLPADCSILARHRGSIKHFILSFLATLSDLPAYEEKSFTELCNVDDQGTTYCGMSPDHNLTLVRDLAERQKNIRADWGPSPKTGKFDFNPEVYSPIINYCQKQEIPLMLVWLPHESSVYNRYWYQKPYTQDWFKSKFDEYAKRLFVFPVYLNTLPEDYAYFSDFRHLSTYGCIRASELLSETLSQQRYRTLIQKRERQATTASSASK